MSEQDESPDRQVTSEDGSPSSGERRSFLHNVSGMTMAAGLVGGYGAFAAAAVRFLYPTRASEKAWIFVTTVKEFETGTSMTYRIPTGAKVNILRHDDAESAESFLALSSTCPHLGCQVHWESANNRYFCPCHNGSFDREGNPTGGPPAEAGQKLSQFPLKVEEGILYIEAPTKALVENVEDSAPGPGHDPCLFQRPNPREA